MSKKDWGLFFVMSMVSTPPVFVPSIVLTAPFTIKCLMFS